MVKVRLLNSGMRVIIEGTVDVPHYSNGISYFDAERRRVDVTADLEATDIQEAGRIADMLLHVGMRELRANGRKIDLGGDVDLPKNCVVTMMLDPEAADAGKAARVVIHHKAGDVPDVIAYDRTESGAKRLAYKAMTAQLAGTKI